MPECWKHKILEGTKKQFGILKETDENSKVVVICATDAGREGELIFRLVYEQAGCKKPMKRLWSHLWKNRQLRWICVIKRQFVLWQSTSQHFAGQRQTGWWNQCEPSFSVLYNRIWKLEEYRHQHLPWSWIEIRRSRNLPRKILYGSYQVWWYGCSHGAFSEKEDADKVAADCTQSVCVSRRTMWRRKQFVHRSSMIRQPWRKPIECLVIPHSRRWMPCRRCMSRSLLLIRERTSIWQIEIWEKAQKLWFRCCLGKCPMPKGWNINRTWARY